MKVAIAVRQSHNLDSIVAGALRFGLTHGDSIAMITVIDTDALGTWALLPPPLVEEGKKFAKEQALITVRHASIQLRTELHSPHIEEIVLDGELMRELPDFLLRWKADMLIIGFSEAPFWGRHCNALVNASPCPVLVTPEPSPSELKLTAPKTEQAKERAGV